MAEAAAARREARRRKILENSHNRLQLISGKISDETLKDTSSNFYSSEQNTQLREYEESRSKSFHLAQSSDILEAASDHDVLCLPPLRNGNAILDNRPLLSEFHDTAAGDTESTNDLAAFVSSVVPDTEESKTKVSTLWDKVVSYKYDIVILSFINQLLYSMFIFETTYFFLPIIMYSVTKLVFYPAQGKSSMANVFMLMNGLSASRVQSIMNASQWFSAISQDVCVYLFVTICTQSLYVALYNFIT